MKVVLSIFIALLGFVKANAQPTTNPYRELYPDIEHHWTENLPWDKVYNINSYSGANWDEKVVNAQNDIVSKGGGILYFPAGTYVFNDDAILRNSVIWRGDASINNNATSADFAPLTRFEFPAFNPVFSGTGGNKKDAFKRIRSEYTVYGLLPSMPDDTVKNIGIVNIDINRANIILHPSYYNQQIPGNATNYTPCILENVILMGVRNNNVAYPLPSDKPGYQEEWQEWPWRYMANLDALAQDNLVICNNRFNDLTNNNIHPITDDSFDQPGYKVYDDNTGDTITYTDGSMARFSYTNHYGLVVNRFYNFYRIDSTGFADGDLIIQGSLAVEPDVTKYKSLFNRGVEIKDNYMYNTQQVAMFVAGTGMLIKNNVIRDKAGKQQWVSRSGYYRIEYDAFLENRGIDFSGFDVTIENNDVEVHSTRFETSGYYSNDGEGIMLQECCGGSRANGITIKGNILTGSNAYIGLYKTQDISNVWIENNMLNGQNIYVNANTNSTDYSCYNVHVDNNTGVHDIVLTGSLFGDECYVTNNIGNTSGELKVSCYVNKSGNSGFSEPACISLTDYFSQPDSLPFVFMTDTFWFPNFQKLKWECLQSGYPLVEFDFPSDTLLVTNQNSVSVDVTNPTTNVDSVMLICNGVSYPPRLLSDPADVVDVSKDGTYYLTYKSWGCGYYLTTYSKGLIIIKDSNQPVGADKNISPATNAKVIIYPNPAAGKVYLQSNQPIYKVKLLNISGLPLKTIIHNNIHEIDISNIQSGIYFLYVEGDFGTQVQKMIIK